ncbi:MAG: ArsR/SmtB family transcription factor [Candidatus Heimdallarchaeota archaeon]
MNSKLGSEFSTEDERALELTARLCQSLTHPFRLKLIHILENGPKNVSQIETETNRPQPFISQHLRVLREKGIVDCERNKNEVHYKLINRRILEICRMVAELAMAKETPSDG